MIGGGGGFIALTVYATQSTIAEQAAGLEYVVQKEINSFEYEQKKKELASMVCACDEQRLVGGGGEFNGVAGKEKAGLAGARA